MNAADEVLFFDDIDDFLDEEAVATPANDPGPDELIEKSAQYFKDLFKDGILDDHEIHSPAAGLLLQQHLSRVGYETSIIVEDRATTVHAVDSTGDSLLSHVQELLERITALYRTSIIANQKGSTIHTVVCHAGLDGSTSVDVKFVPV